MANTNDLRYQRTERIIRASFMELVSGEPANALSVSALCRHAGISRNAFYLHYASIAALYGALVNELVADVRAESLASSERVKETGDVDTKLARNIIMALGRHEKLLRALLPTDDGPLAKRLAEGIESAFVEAGSHIAQRGASFEHRINCAFGAWAVVGLVMRWINETDRTLEESLPIFAELQAGLTESTTRFLTARS